MIQGRDAEGQGDGKNLLPPTSSVLVTGGAGFIGANLVRMLLGRGYQVSVLDNLSTGRSEFLAGLPIQFYEGDIRNAATVEKAVAGRDAVVHLAAQTGVPGSLANPRRDCDVNVLGTLNVLEACRAEMEEPNGRSDRKKAAGGKLPGPRLIFASSNAPLGRQTPPASEDKAPLPVSPYGASKLAGEAYCLAYHGSWGLRTVALRFGNVYGPYSGHKSSVVAKFFQGLLAGRPLLLDGDGEQTRDFIYVEDLCNAILCALENPVSGEIFQIATGVETSIRRLATLIQEAAGRKAGFQHGPARDGDVRRNFSAISKARSLLHWEPTVDLVHGLSRTWNWFLCQSSASQEPITSLSTGSAT